MGKWRWIGIFLAVTLMMASLGVGLPTWAAPEGQDATPAEIEPQLQTVLETEGQANLFVMFHDQPDLSPAYTMSWVERGEFVYQSLLRTAQRSQAQMRAYLDARRIPYQSFIIDNSIYISGANQVLAEELTTFSGVSLLRLERSYPIPKAEAEPEQPGVTAAEWGVAKINADDVWGMGYSGQGIVVANVDTGVRYTHNALEDNYRGNLGGGSFDHTYSWSDPTGTYPSAPGDNHGHGTHTMGTIAGDDGGSNQIGVAPGAQWIACKGCTNVNCPDSYLNACADWMLAPGGNTAMRPQVVNNSWGGCDYDNWYRTKTDAWRAAGIHPVFSAGNTSNCGYTSPFCGSHGTPGTYKEVTAVGSTTSTDGISSFSLWGPSQDPTAPNEIKPEVSAPGSSIRSASYSSDSGYTTMSGTSMAAPHVSGALAVIWSACPSLIGDFDGTEQLLKDSALQIAYATGCGNEGSGNIPNNAYGYGRIDVLAAFNDCYSAGPTPTPTDTPPPTPVASILLVDDDNGSTYESYFTAALDALGKNYNVWTVQSQGSPSAATLAQHEIVIWFTGNDYTTTLTSTDQSNLASYLDGGGKLFITGQDIGYDIRTDAFYGDYLHASYVADDTNTYGLTGYDIMSGVDVNISGGDGADNQGYPSEIGLGSDAVGLYDYDGSYTWGGLRWEGAYKLVYLSFGFEAINSAGDRNAVMSNALAWLEGGAPPTDTPTPTPTDTPTSTPTDTPTSTPTNTPTPTPTGSPTPTPTNTPTPGPGASILLVDDDNGSTYESYFTAALDALGKNYNVWTVQSQGSPSAATLGQYEIVIWFTGDDYTTTLTSTDQSNLASYLDGSGDLFITGQDIGYDIRTAAFYGDYLHASYVADDTNTYGLTGYDIMSGVDVNISGGDGADNQGYPSEIGLGSDAVGLYDYDGSYTWGGLRWEGAYKLVYLSFGFEAINSAGDRNAVMSNALAWLEGGAPPTDTPTPPPTDTPTPGPGPVFSDDFETDLGWTANPSGSDTATTGMWERANPEGTSYGGNNYQLGTTTSGVNDLVTGPLAGSGIGSYDIDGGVTSIRSPDIALPGSGNITLSFQYYLAHYSNASSADFLRVTVVGATTVTVFEELGAANIDAGSWQSFSTSLNSFAGQTIYLLVEAADAGSASLVEAAIDDVSIDVE